MNSPITIGSATKDAGIITTSMMANIFQIPNLKLMKGVNPNNKEVNRVTKYSEPFSAYVFKTSVVIFRSY